MRPGLLPDQADRGAAPVPSPPRGGCWTTLALPDSLASPRPSVPIVGASRRRGQSGHGRIRFWRNTWPVRPSQHADGNNPSRPCLRTTFKMPHPRRMLNRRAGHPTSIDLQLFHKRSRRSGSVSRIARRFLCRWRFAGEVHAPALAGHSAAAGALGPRLPRKPMLQAGTVLRFRASSERRSDQRRLHSRPVPSRSRATGCTWRRGRCDRSSRS